MTKTKISGDQANSVAEGLICFAILHKCVITPVGYNYLIDKYLKLGHCPCKPNRKLCPCIESVAELADQGHCHCRMFWRDYETYLAFQAKIKGGAA